MLPGSGKTWPADDCELRSVDGPAIEQSILNVLNALPSCREAIELARARLTWGELARYDRLIERQEKRNTMLKDLVGSLASDDCAETESNPARVTRTANSIEEKRLVTLQAERAEAANREMQLRMLLGLIDQLGSQTNTLRPVNSTPACYTAADFYTRTRYVVPAHLLSAQHRLERFDDALVARYLSKVVVTNGHRKVYLKAGIVASLDLAPTDGETVAAFETIGV